MPLKLYWFKIYTSAFYNAGIGAPYASAFKSAGIGLLKSAGIGSTYSSAFKSTDIGLESKEFKRPIPALSKALV